MPIQDEIRAAMTSGSNLDIEFDVALNGKAPGNLDVYLHQTSATLVRIDLDNTGELARILWLPWKQGELTCLQSYSIESAAANTLFFTYYLSGCKVFAIQGGPVWHIDAPITVAEFWPPITSSEWVEDYWPVGETQPVAYLHRAGQAPAYWDLSDYLAGPAPSTYGNQNVGQAIVGGIVNADQQLDLYMKASPWTTFAYNKEQRKK